ncbi:MAG TPA: hypothetical protein PLN96_03025 [Zoogloea sp.]|uniref:hypothetical protein n=1 Tax=Zoogloea sp. TaxID=49181 RepID=UPI002C933EC3|nr:hypothetical protein [Zoogloea sp.]HMY50825.1 hypothetical protein [Rhodocyclaceae bacterium]HNC91686.1 hypothetical protein [Anaerolineales bacterium]HMZ76451.1 hypothetical protein [Rhodocyclaceae bacterium]HNA68647.1 hypothetical protein [Rhodocyclaceae bacterium]HNB65587.1 hypothetical protein [Rhodocyclaceae bacterium]
MIDLEMQLRRADRLDAITKSLGFALWQLQALEETTANYYVLVALATRGMGIEAGRKLDDSVKGNTFGKTIHALRDSGKMPSKIEQRFLALLKERNWLVHKSRATNRGAVHDNQACDSLLVRLDQLAEEARLLLREIGKASEKFVVQSGVPIEEVDRLTHEILNSWHSTTNE